MAGTPALECEMEGIWGEERGGEDEAEEPGGVAVAQAERRAEGIDLGDDEPDVHDRHNSEDDKIESMMTPLRPLNVLNEKCKKRAQTEAEKCENERECDGVKDEEERNDDDAHCEDADQGEEEESPEDRDFEERDGRMFLRVGALERGLRMKYLHVAPSLGAEPLVVQAHG